MPSVRTRLAAAYRGTAVVLLNSVLLFAVVEGIARLVAPGPQVGIREDLFGGPEQRMPGFHYTLPYYQVRSWGQDYWRELRAIGTWYQPYVIWRREPFEGRYIVVDQEGVRRTPGADCRPGAYRVFAMGGSTMWGYGSPDDATIPAYLQAELARRRTGPVCVVNLSDHGFTSTQDLIQLQQRLVRGDVPDLAVFLQGTNDVWAAYMSGRPGVHGFLGEIAGKLEGTGAAPVRRVVSRLALVRALHPPRPTDVSRWTTTDTQLADSVVAIYLENYRMLRSLAQTYGFEYRVFWQPSIHTGRKRLTPEEQAMRAEDLAAAVEAWPRMIARTYQEIGRRAPRDGSFHDLRDAFDDRSELIYIDHTHVVPEGNRILADRILTTLPR